MTASIFASLTKFKNPLFGICLSADKTKYLCTRDSIPTFITSFDLDGNKDPNPFLTSTNPNSPFNLANGLLVETCSKRYLTEISDMIV